MTGDSPTSAESSGSPLQLIKHTAIYGSGYISVAAVSLVLVPVYAHQLSPSEFGLLALMLVLYGLMKQVYDLGLMNSVGRFYFDYQGPEQEAELHHMRATGLAFIAAYGGLLTAALLLLAPDVSRLLTGEDGQADLVRIVAATLYAEALTIVPLTLIRMQERSVLFVSISVARTIASLVLSVVFVVSLDLGVRGALLGTALPAVAVLVLLASEYRLAFKGRVSSTLLRRMLVFGLPFFPVLLSGWVVEASDRYLLELLASREEVGEYSLAYRVGQVVQIAVAAFAMGWAPIRYRIYEEPDAPSTYRRLASYYVIAAAVLCVPIALFAGEIVALIAPPSYAAAADVVPLIVLAYGISGLNILMITGMGVAKRTGPLAWVAAAGAALNIGLNIVLIPEWGIVAAALTTVLANVVMTFGAWFYSQRAYPIPYDWRRVTTVVTLAAAVTSLAALISPSGTLGGSAVGLAAWLLFIASLVAFRVVSPTEVRAAWSRLRGFNAPSVRPSSKPEPSA